MFTWFWLITDEVLVPSQHLVSTLMSENDTDNHLPKKNVNFKLRECSPPSSLTSKLQEIKKDSIFEDIQVSRI